METNKNKAVFLFIIALGFILSIGAIKADQGYAIPEKSDNLLPVGNSRSAQEKSNYRFIGIDKCAAVCHNNEKMGFQLNIWNSSLHKDTYEILLSKRAEKYAEKAHLMGNPQESKVCLKCHVTGGDLDSSCFTDTYQKEEGVTCEACHKQITDGKTYLPDEEDCLKCHNDSVHKMGKFNFKDKSAKIAHPRPVAKLNEP
jgi:hypothetical protein